MMHVLAKTILIIGLVVINTPHLLCPYSCAATEQVVTEKSKCPHCSHQKPAIPSNSAPAEECESGCCDQELGVLTAFESQDLSSFVSLDKAPIDSITVHWSVGEETLTRIELEQPPPSLHPGSILSILLGRFLL